MNRHLVGCSGPKSVCVGLNALRVDLLIQEAVYQDTQ